MSFVVVGCGVNNPRIRKKKKKKTPRNYSLSCQYHILYHLEYCTDFVVLKITSGEGHLFDT